MGIENWNHSKFLPHKARNATRRGYLTKTYYDKKLMQLRFKTGEKIENDRIDLVQPAGFLGRHPPGEKCEMTSSDIGGDTSRRLCNTVIGDREHHPKIDEAESILYSPSDKENYVRVKGEKQQQQGQGRHDSGAEFEDPYDGEGQESDKNPKGIHAKTKHNETHAVDKTFQVETSTDIRIKTTGRMYVKAEQGVHFDCEIYALQGWKPGNGAWGNKRPEKYPGSVIQQGRSLSGFVDADPAVLSPAETEQEPVPERPRGFEVDAEGNVTFTGSVTFKGAVRFAGPVHFDGGVTYAEDKTDD